MDLRNIAVASCIACLTAGCSGDDGVTKESIVLSARLSDGSSLAVTLDSSFKPYVDTCRGLFELSTWSGTQWVPARDDRSAADSERGYFLDGDFVEPSGACDESTACVTHPTYVPPHSLALLMTNFQARALVKVGTQPAPDAKSGAPEVDVIESRPLTGRIEVTNFYYRNDKCSGPPESITTEAVGIGP